MKAGIFKITFPDNTFWLGFTRDYSYALEYHIGWFNRDTPHPSRTLQEAFDLNGDYDFEFVEEMHPEASQRALEVRRDNYFGEGCLNRKKAVNKITNRHRYLIQLFKAQDLPHDVQDSWIDRFCELRKQGLTPRPARAGATEHVKRLAGI